MTTNRKARRADERRAKKDEARRAGAPAKVSVLSRISTDWIVGGIIVAVFIIAGVIFFSRQHFGGGGSSATAVTQVMSVAATSNPKTLFLGDAAGLLRSEDGGKSWQKVQAVSEVAVFKVYVNPTNPSEVYAAAGTTLRKSVDGGTTWQTITTNLPAGLFGALAFDPSGSPRAYAYLAGVGLFKSEDGGATWTQQNAVPDAQINSLAIKPGSPDTVYAFHNVDGLVVSVDGGQRFQKLGEPGFLARNRVSDIVTYAEEPEAVIAAAGAGVYKSTDSGKTWKPMITGLENADIRVVTRNPSTGALYGVDYAGGVFVSTDGGQNWARGTGA